MCVCVWCGVSNIFCLPPHTHLNLLAGLYSAFPDTNCCYVTLLRLVYSNVISFRYAITDREFSLNFPPVHSCWSPRLCLNFKCFGEVTAGTQPPLVLQQKKYKSLQVLIFTLLKKKTLQVAGVINESKRKADNMNKIVQVQELMEGYKVTFLSLRSHSSLLLPSDSSLTPSYHS